MDWKRNGARPPKMPADPGKVYKNDGWQGWHHWLGTGKSARGGKVSLPPDEAHQAGAGKQSPKPAATRPTATRPAATRPAATRPTRPVAKVNNVVRGGIASAVARGVPAPNPSCTGSVTVTVAKPLGIGLLGNAEDGIRVSMVKEDGMRHEPFNVTLMGVNSISSAHLHARPMWALGTCR